MGINLTDSTYISVNYTKINISVNSSILDEFRFQWNNTNYTFLGSAGNSTAMTIGDDNSLVLAMAFNNMSEVGESYNNSAGMFIYDYSGLGNNGTTATTAASPTYNSTGKFGGAFMFDGVNDYVDCGGDNSLKPTDAITVEAWVYIDSTANDNIVAHLVTTTRIRDPTGGYLIAWEDRGGAYGNNGIFFTVTAGDGTGAQSKREDIVDGWHHVVGTYDKDIGGTEEVKLYIDGILEAMSDYSKAIDQSPTNLKIGGSLYAGEYYNGTIDEVRIYNRSLSAEEIRLSYGSYLSQLNSTHWEFYSNITNEPDATYTYQGWANDTAGNEGETGVRTLTIDTTDPAISITLPVNSTHYNLNPTLNATITDLSGISYAYYNITNSSGDLVNSSSLTNYTDYYTCTWDTQTVDDGNYSIVFWANDTVGNSNVSLTYKFIVDNTNPVWYIQSTPRSDNKSIHSLTMTLDPYVQDLYLWKVLRNITNFTGDEMYSNLTTVSAGTTRYDVTDTIDVSGWNDGFYNITLTACDSHTLKKIPSYQHKKLSDGFGFVTPEKNRINITVKVGAVAMDLRGKEPTPVPIEFKDFKTIKKTDRYTLKFITKTALTKRQWFDFYVTSDKPIEYLENSPFKAHLVIGDVHGGNWIDFKNSDPKAEYKVKRISKNSFKVSIWTNDLNFSSLGGLNEVTEIYSFTVDNTSPTINSLNFTAYSTIVRAVTQLQDFTLAANLTDANNEVLMNVTWFIDGTENTTWSVNEINCSLPLNGWCNSTILITSNYTAVGENWTAMVSAWDTAGNVVRQNASITISRHHPDIYANSLALAAAAAGTAAFASIAWFLRRRRGRR